MKVWLAVALLAVARPAFAGDWRESLTPSKPGKFAPLPPLKATYRFGWGALSAARAQFDFSKLPRGELRLTVSTATSGAVRALWRMDARHEAICRQAALRPVSLVQTETYSDESLRTRVTFDAEGVSRLRESVPANGKPARTKRFECPNVFDLQTGLLFVRSQPLRTGDIYRFVVYPAVGAYLARVSVVGSEKMQAAGRSYEAVKLEIQLQAVEKNLRLAAHKKFKRATAWLSDDRDRLLLKIAADVAVGSVWAELEKVEIAAR